jgi:glycerophosphoryl diester phosphodiesterase
VVAAQVPVRFGRMPVISPGFVATAHAAGLEVHAWTIDNPAEMNRLLDLGVDGIMTDRPDVLRDVLQRMVDGHPVNRLDELLPWSWKPVDHVKT